MIGTILGQAIISSLENSDFCGIAGGGNAAFELLVCAGTCEVVGVGGGRAIPPSHVVGLGRQFGARTLATTTFRKHFNLLGITQRQRKWLLTW